MGEAVTIADPAGNEKLAKSSEGGRRSRARDDAAATAILAVAGATGSTADRRRSWSELSREAAGGKLAAVRPQAQAFGWWWLEQGAPRQPSLFGVGPAALGAGAPPVIRSRRLAMPGLRQVGPA